MKHPAFAYVGNHIQIYAWGCVWFWNECALAGWEAVLWKALPPAADWAELYIHKYSSSNNGKDETFHTGASGHVVQCIVQLGIICSRAVVNKKVNKPHGVICIINKNQLHLLESIDLYLALKTDSTDFKVRHCLLWICIVKTFIITGRLLKVGKHHSALIKNAFLGLVWFTLQRPFVVSALLFVIWYCKTFKHSIN